MRKERNQSQIRVQILAKLLRKTGCPNSNLAGADALNVMPKSSFDMVTNSDQIET